MSSVYKSRSFVTDDEKVQIPDVVFTEEKTALDPLGGEQPGENPQTAGEEAGGPDQTTETAGIPADNTGAQDTAAESGVPDGPEAKTKRAQAQQPEPARPITKELIGEFYAAELRQLAAEVAQQAYYDALNKKKAELRECVANVQQAMDELVRAQQKFMADYTDELKYMAVDIAEKMIFEKIQEDDLILERLVMQTVSAVKNADWVDVEVSERLVGLIDQINKELEKPEFEGKAHVFPIAGTDGVCRVVTNEGAVVSSIEAQAENLRRAFKELDQQKAALQAENG